MREYDNIRLISMFTTYFVQFVADVQQQIRQID